MSEDLIQFYIDNSNNDPEIFNKLGRIVTSDIVNKNLNKPWDYDTLVLNPNITWDILKKNLKRDRITCGNLSRHPKVTWDIVKANPDIKWCYSSLISNPNITIEIIKANPDKNWNFDALNNNPNITWDFIKKNPDIKWSYSVLSSNPNITWDIIKANPDKPWCYTNGLISNPNITFNIIKDNPDKFGSYIFTCEHNNMSSINRLKSLTWNTIKANPDIPWHYGALGNNPNITWDIIKTNPDKPWNYTGLSFNPKITLDIVMNNTDRAWFMITEIKMYKLQKMIEAQQYTIEKISRTNESILNKLDEQIKLNAQLCDRIFEMKEEKFREGR
jgi:hypothetical protein